MSTNHYFNNFRASGEQALIDDLIIESIRIYGIDLFFLPKRSVHIDEIFREEELVEFNDAYPVEMFIKNVDGFEGEGDLFSKFGLEIRDRITFTLARRTFSKYIGSVDPDDLTRPREGDLIWFPLNQKLFTIKFVEHESIFYQMGSLQTYDLVCELFEYNNETFNTGIPEINERYVPLDRDIGVASPEDVILNDPFAMNDVFETDGHDILDFTERDPFSEGNNY